MFRTATQGQIRLAFNRQRRPHHDDHVRANSFIDCSCLVNDRGKQDHRQRTRPQGAQAQYGEPTESIVSSFAIVEASTPAPSLRSLMALATAPPLADRRRGGCGRVDFFVCRAVTAVPDSWPSKRPRRGQAAEEVSCGPMISSLRTRRLHPGNIARGSAGRKNRRSHAVCGDWLGRSVPHRRRRHVPCHVDARCRDRCCVSSWRGRHPRVEFEHQSPVFPSARPPIDTVCRRGSRADCSTARPCFPPTVLRSAPQPSVALTVNAGGGLKMPMNDTLDLRTDARWFKSFGRPGSEQFRVSQGISFDVGKR